MLTSIEIELMLRGKVKYFGGVYAIDKLPITFTKPKDFIINLDPSYKEGSHWVAVHFGKNSAIYFDSFGRPPSDLITNFIERNSKRFEYSRIKYQANDSFACGYYCILFVSTPRKKDFFKFFDKSKCNHLKNEMLLYKKIKQNLK